MTFAIGDRVEKFTGDYRLAGEVRAVIDVHGDGKVIRYTVRHDVPDGGWFLHIYSAANLRAVDTDFGRNRVPLEERPEEWGNSIEIGWIDGPGDTIQGRRLNGRESSMDEKQAITFLHNDARKVLPPGARYEIRQASRNFGRTKGFAWYRCSTMDARPTWGASMTRYDDALGVYILGECTTPGAEPAAITQKTTA